MNKYSYITLLSLYESLKPIVNACHDSFTETQEPLLSSKPILSTMEEEEKEKAFLSEDRMLVHDVV